MRLNFKTITIALSALLMAGIVSCKHESKNQKRQKDILNVVRTVLGAVNDGSTFTKATDSLYQAGEISTLMKGYLDGYYIMYDEENYDSATVVFQNILNQNTTDSHDRLVQIAAAGELINIMEIQNYIESLTLTALDVLKRFTIEEASQDMVALDYYIRAHGDVGLGMMGRGDYVGSKEYFEKSYDLYSKYEDQIPEKEQWLIRRVGLLSNIVLSSYKFKQYEQAVLWSERAEADLEKYNKMPRAIKDAADTYMHNFLAVKSASLQYLNRPVEAEAAYKAFLKTDKSKSPLGNVNKADYLFAARRYREAAKALEDLNHVLSMYGIGMSLDEIQNNYLRKFHANMLSGRRDTAVAVAIEVCEALDSAIMNYNHERSSELAAIYNVQQKDAEIAEQKASLLQARMMALLVALGLLVSFFVIYTVFRNRQRMRLEEKNQQLLIANARAEESSRMKTKFIQQISHEIRTPLNILSGFAQVITTPGIELDEDSRKDANLQILENTDRITGLVNKMIELSDITSRTLIERTDQVSAVQIAADAVQISGIERAPHLTFTQQFDDGVEQTVLTTNQRAAVRALSLLLDNAIKFTAPAEAHAHLQPTAEQQHACLKLSIASGCVQFVVEDSGIGVPSEEAEHIFDEFVQLDEYYDGTGIGLTVARSMTRHLGGDVVLDTTNTTGARFVMTLPCS